MKWQKFSAIRKQHPWIKQFVGIPDIYVNRKRGIWDKKQEGKIFKDWVRNRLDYIVFRSIDSLPDFLCENYVTQRLEHVTQRLEINIDNNIRYPYWSYGVYYILYHNADNVRPFSKKYCPESGSSLGDGMKWLRNDCSEKLVFDGILFVMWSARVFSGTIKQAINVWLLPEDFKL